MTNEELSQAIGHFLQAATAAADILSSRQNASLEYVNIEDALVDLLRVDSPVDLLSRNLNEKSLVSLLDNYDFSRVLPVTICDVILREPAIPVDGRFRLVEVTIKNRGEVWRVHKNDADPWPSNPHAHNLESGLTLHLGTGELFMKRRNTGRRISKKHLEAIRSEIPNCSLPPLTA